MAYKLKPDPPQPKPPAEPPKRRRPETEVPAEPQRSATGRLISLDAFRGFIMVMLAANGFGLSRLATINQESALAGFMNSETAENIAFHFEHPPWQSNFLYGSRDATTGSAWWKLKVSFWDLIQPAFMFMVGVAMPFSYARREAEGQSRRRRTWHALLRAIVLTLLGVFLYSLNKSSTNWIFPNVLAQIGLGYFFAYLLLGRKLWIQWSALVVILVGTTLAVQFTGPFSDYVPAEVNADPEKGEVLAAPYLQWSKNGNAFHKFDVWFLNLFPTPEGEPFRFNGGGYQTLNFVPSIATMLLGILCGQLLLTDRSHGRKFFLLLVFALVTYGLGVTAGATCCPIIKRIWTPSWVLFSGGYVIGMLALFYLLFEMTPLKKVALPLTVVGANSIAVYMMGQMLRGWFNQKVVGIHFDWAVDGLLGLIARSAGLVERLGVEAAAAGPALHTALAPIVDATTAFLCIWLVAYWMYRQKIFIRI